MEAEARFHAMGADAHVVVVDGENGAVEAARERIDELERLWSRFIPDSEVSRMNASAGTSVTVRPETMLLVRKAIDGWRATAGLFDPTILEALVDAGYDRTFADLPRKRPAPEEGSRPAPGCGSIEIDEGESAVTLPSGAGFDPGGIGKGLAADIVVEEIMSRGAAGACVNIGGDLRASGEAPSGGLWTVAIEDPDGGQAIGTVALAEGAIATSSRARRTWRRGEDMWHHLIDPATGAPATSRTLTVTVVAGLGWWAETLAKAAFLSSQEDAAAMLEAARTPGLITLDNGEALAIAGMEQWLS